MSDSAIIETKNDVISDVDQERKTEESPIATKEVFQEEISDSQSKCCAPGHFLHCDKKLMKFKSFFFFFGGAIGSVFPYFSVYFKQIGLSPNQIGIIAGLRPIIGFCSGSFWGSIADHFRIRRIVLFCSALGWLAFISSVGFVPSPERSEDQCTYVNTFIGGPENNSFTDPNSDTLKEHFNDLHKPRPDITPEEGLQESRGWMYDYGEIHRVFITIMVLVILGELVQAPCGALADSGCIEHLGDRNFNQYGHQRAWGSLGLGIFSLVVGGLVSATRYTTITCGIEVVISNYKIAFYFFAGSMLCCVITTFFFRFQKQADAHSDAKPKPNPLKVLRMFLTLHYGSWLFSMFFTGVCNGVIWGFLFWHLENIGGNQLLLGLANSISLFSEMLMFLFVFRILDKTGCLLFMGLGLLGYTIRFIVFAVIENPWIVLPFEILQGCTFAGVWSVYTKYLCYNVPSEYLGTLQGFLHGVYWGLGAGSGSLLGGLLVQNFGARVVFWVFAVGSLVNVVIFLIIQKCTTRPDVFGNYEEFGDTKSDKNTI